jgi:methylenetetrahydrofolate dehydrogenase (NADP+) / methenyltetrahydrofolate cyclohydrolase
MTASILDGKSLAANIIANIKEAVSTRRQQGKPAPGLAVVIVGNDPASTIYVTNKRRACLEVGFNSFDYNLACDVSEQELLALIDTLNANQNVHGILIQLPLPAQINTSLIIERIHPQKDVDGFHPYNMGRLAQGNPLLRPCTPYGIMTLLTHYNIALRGKHAVILGSSNIVGRPLALEFLLAKSTVTVCHSATQGLEQHIRSADIIVSATGKPQLIDTNWLNKNQICVDVGIHRTPEGIVHGDIDFNFAKDKVAWITPVPGGVGPMTIAMLLQNTWEASENQG